MGIEGFFSGKVSQVSNVRGRIPERNLTGLSFLKAVFRIQIFLRKGFFLVFLRLKYFFMIYGRYGGSNTASFFSDPYLRG